MIRSVIIYGRHELDAARDTDLLSCTAGARTNVECDTITAPWGHGPRLDASLAYQPLQTDGEASNTLRASYPLLCVVHGFNALAAAQMEAAAVTKTMLSRLSVYNHWTLTVAMA